jgi:Outer membrane protein beta-barrel domain
MNKLVLLVVFLGLLLLPAMAADTPKAEVFGGYQYTRVNVEGTGFNFNGWNASLTGNVNNWFGVTGDFSGAYKTESGVSVKVYTYTFGPTVSLNHEGKVNPFVHALFGGAHLSASLEGTGGGTNGFAMEMGGGVDAKLSPHLAFRAVQADWVYYRFQGVGESKNVRLSTGIVFRF